MRITEKLKEKITLAEGLGYNYIVIKKGGTFSCAIVEVPFNILLKQKIGTNYDTGIKGRFPNKENPPLEGGIGYFEVLKLEEGIAL